ncbi:MAG: ribose-phosphate diphosphokinase [Candidatus Syntropharchaeia archaeon]
MKIVSGPASQNLAARVAKEMNCELVPCEFKCFPDGEVYTRVEGVEGEVTIIQSMGSDTDIVYLLQLIDACEDADRINVVIPYFRYARQDKRFKRGEPISAKTIARMIAGDRIYVINLHSRKVLDYFNAKVVELDAVPLLGRYISEKIDDPLLIAPDEGAAHLVEELEFDYEILSKTRISSEEVSIERKEIDVKGRNVVMVDDIVSTGGTMEKAAQMLREGGVKSIYVACIHGLFVGNAILRLFRAGIEEIFATDTIESSLSVVSVAPIITRGVK